MKFFQQVAKIVGHGVNAFVNRQLIYNFPEELFADAGVLAVEHADFDGIEVRDKERERGVGRRRKKKKTDPLSLFLFLDPSSKKN